MCKCLKSCCGMLLSLLLAAPIISYDLSSEKLLLLADGSTIESTSDSTGLIIPHGPWPDFNAQLSNGLIKTTFSSYGHLSNYYVLFPNKYVTPSNPAGFEVPEGSGKEYSFFGFLWVGGIVGADTLVSTGSDGWASGAEELRPPEFPEEGTVSPFEFISDIAFRAEFTDTIIEGIVNDASGRPHKPLNIEIVNRAYAWTSDPANRIIIYDFVITNIGDQTIDETYCGFYFDNDIGQPPFAYYDDDLTGSIPLEGVGYAIDNDGEMGFSPEDDVRRAFAFKLLKSSDNVSRQNYNWWISNGSAPLDFGPRKKGTPEDPFRQFRSGAIGTPVGDADKYYILSHPEWDYSQFFAAKIAELDTTWMEPPSADFIDDYADGFDTRFLMSYGNFALPPDSSLRLIVTTFTADNVHVAPGNIVHLPNNPIAYLANLNFEEMLFNAEVADSLADLVINPANPVIGLRTIVSNDDSVTIKWDPHCFADVSGYELYLYEVPDAALLKTGICPPWLEPGQLNTVAILPTSARSYTFTDLDPNKFYLVNIANQYNGQVGSVGKPIIINQRSPMPAPEVDIEYTFFKASEPVVLNWHEPEGTNVDHYNVYKFAGEADYNARHHRFYDEGFYKDSLSPDNVYNEGSKEYFYYEMETYGQTTPGNPVFEDYNPAESAIYIVSYVDNNGFESAFSRGVKAFEVYEPLREILVLTNGYTNPPRFSSFVVVKSFYDSILTGYDYAVFNYNDTLKKYGCQQTGVTCYDWREFTRYKLVILDDDLREWVLRDTVESKNKDLTKYALNGGRIAYFGTLSGINGFVANTPADYYLQSSVFVNRFFGIESAFYYPLFHYLLNSSLPFVDTNFGFNHAQSVDEDFGDISFDLTRDPFVGLTGSLSTVWPDSTPPSVAAFTPTENGRTIHLYRSLYPEVSYLEGMPVGIHTHSDEAETYLFGFHLWYMDYQEARELVDALYPGTPGQYQPKVAFEPAPIYSIYANAIEPIDGHIFLGNIGKQNSVNDLDPASLVINNQIIPAELTILPSHEGFKNEVLKLSFPIREFILGYGLLYDSTEQIFSVSGQLLSGEPLTATGTVWFRSHRSGDVDLNGTVDIADLLMLVEYEFQGVSRPVPIEAGDVNEDAAVDISDLMRLVEEMF